ncbi:hypothetical protein T261_8086 [Streptomyces lydicus]|nr:hypothetical protein T261_8086 [Streptomyces lydicus]
MSNSLMSWTVTAGAVITSLTGAVALASAASPRTLKVPSSPVL